MRLLCVIEHGGIETTLPDWVAEVCGKASGGNSTIWKVLGVDSRYYALKLYRDAERRDREHAAIRFMRETGITCIPDAMGNVEPAFPSPQSSSELTALQMPLKRE